MKSHHWLRSYWQLLASRRGIRESQFLLMMWPLVSWPLSRAGPIPKTSWATRTRLSGVGWEKKTQSWVGKKGRMERWVWEESGKRRMWSKCCIISQRNNNFKRFRLEEGRSEDIQKESIWINTHWQCLSDHQGEQLWILELFLLVKVSCFSKFLGPILWAAALILFFLGTFSSSPFLTRF